MKKLKKMSLANIQGKMSRAEMKKIMAGSAGDDSCGTYTCGSCQGNCKCGDSRYGACVVNM